MLTSIIFLVIFFIFIILVLGTSGYAALIAAPWVPVYKKDLKRIFELADLKPGQTFFELGAGDGRLLFEAAKVQDVKAVGFEISWPFFILLKLKKFFKHRYQKIEILYKDFYHQPFNQADVVFCFLSPKAMKRLKPKFSSELKKGAKVVSCAFSIPGLEPKSVSKPTKRDFSIYLYEY